MEKEKLFLLSNKVCALFYNFLKKFSTDFIIYWIKYYWDIIIKVLFYCLKIIFK